MISSFSGIQLTLSRILPTVRSRLFAFAAILVLIYGVLSVSWIVADYRGERETVLRALTNAASAHSQTIDRTIDQSEALLRGLATSPHLQSGDLKNFYDQVQQVKPEAGSWIVLQSTNGQQLLNSDFAFGAQLSANPNRPTWLSIEENERYISNVTGGFTGRGPLVFVTVPVYRGGALIYGLSFMITPEFLHKRIYQDAMPKSWMGGIVDREGRVITRRWDVRGRSGERTLLNPETMRDTVRGTLEMSSPEGTPVFAAFVNSAQTGWSMVVSVPREHLLSSIRKSLLLLLSVTIGLLVVGLMVASIVARSIARPVESLARYAAELADGKIFSGPHITLRETAAVAARLQDTSKALEEQQAALRALNQDLELRVAERTRELEAAQEDLVQAKKLEALGQLTGGIAHDFNNLLMAIVGNLSLLRRRVPDDSLAFVENATAAANRGAHLVSQMLAFARRQQLTPEPVDVNAVMSSMESLLKSTLGTAISVTTSLKEPLSPAIADRTQLELVILNLAINARDAMPMGGTLTIETRVERVERRSFRQEEPEPGDYVVIMVSDNGTGMSPHVLAHALDPFFTTKDIGKGSGLGLSQVLGVVKQLGGGLRIDSAHTRGTTIHIYLPQTAADFVQDVVHGENGIKPTLVGLNILLVDDDPDVRLVTAAMLEDLGCTVREATSGYALLDVLEQERDVVFDLVVLDYAMPGMSGLEAAARIDELRPNLPILMMTGYEAGFEHTWSGEMLHKPFDEDRLRERIVALCNVRNIVPFRRSA